MPLRIPALLTCFLWCSAAMAQTPQTISVPAELTGPVQQAQPDSAPAPGPVVIPPPANPVKVEVSGKLDITVKNPPADSSDNPGDGEIAPWAIERIVVSPTSTDGGWITLRPQGDKFRLEWGANSNYLSVTDTSGKAISYAVKSEQVAIKVDGKDTRKEYITVTPTVATPTAMVTEFRMHFLRTDLIAGVSYQALVEPPQQNIDGSVELRRTVSILNPTDARWDCNNCRVEVRSSLAIPAGAEPVTLTGGQAVSPKQQLAVALPESPTGTLYLPAAAVPTPQPGVPFKVKPVPLIVQLEPAGEKKPRPVLPEGTIIGLYQRSQITGIWEWQADTLLLENGPQFPAGLQATPVAQPLELSNGRLTYGLIGEYGKEKKSIPVLPAVKRTMPLLLEPAVPTDLIKGLKSHLAWLVGEAEPGLVTALAQVEQTDQQIEAVHAQIHQAAFDSSTLPAGERDRLISGLRGQLAELRKIRIRQINAYNALAMVPYRFGSTSNVIPPPPGEAASATAAEGAGAAGPTLQPSTP